MAALSFLLPPLLLLLLLTPSPFGHKSAHSANHTLLTQPFQPQTSTTAPSLPVQWQSNSCLLDLAPQLLHRIKLACWGNPFISRRRCCPLLAAWLMAARAKFALKAPVAQTPDMPVLPDDSMICVGNMKAVLESHGIHLSAPNASCDVAVCFCGIRLKDISMSTCATTSPESSELYINSSVAFRSIRALEMNCSEHSYRGCTKCLATLQEVDGSISTRRSGRSKNGDWEDLDCKLMVIMRLLAKNSTLYIPTVSTVLRAIMYSGHGGTKAPECSRDWMNMPLALDSSQVQRSVALSLRLPRSYFYLGFPIASITFVLVPWLI